MSDDVIVSLAERRPRRVEPIGGGVIIGNDQLYIPMSKTASHEVQWAFSSTFDLAGEKGCPISGSFLAAPFDEDAPMGNADLHEHGVNAQFVVGPGFADLIQGAAFSAVPFDIVIGFYADETGAVRDLSLSIQRKRSA
ncbi:hypothetical protein [Brevundimonas subvibrioides]|uniref:hypothetical protein n=1 Tax=Brevundimonas subvibrioides TaxID=74313 RepID=UPI0022B37945|nr:hypothetical protein [Brevundimonas subvibrioides]